MGFLAAIFGSTKPTEKSVVEKIRKDSFLSWTQFNKEEYKIGVMWASNVMSDFGQTLENHSNFIENSKVLPHSKTDIINAFGIMIIYHGLNNNVEAVSDLQLSLLFLANFQELDKNDAEMVANFKDVSKEMQEALKDDTNSSDMDEKMEEYQKVSSIFRKYSDKALKETENLQNILNDINKVLTKIF